MGFHHVALATHDAEATHRFYTELMGFELVKVVASPVPEGTGFFRHFFYKTDRGPGDQRLMAFFQFEDDGIGTDFEANVNVAAGLPSWVNHVAFDVESRAELDAHRQRWVDHGHTVIEIDHGFCVSIYLADPSGNTVEFCHNTREFTDEEKAEALALLTDPSPPLDADARHTIHRPTSHV